MTKYFCDNLPKHLSERTCQHDKTILIGDFNLTIDNTNVDHTLLLFVLDDGRTYNEKDSKEIWFSISKSGLIRRQIIIQLTNFVDGIRRANR